MPHSVQSLRRELHTDFVPVVGEQCRAIIADPALVSPEVKFVKWLDVEASDVHEKVSSQAVEALIQHCEEEEDARHHGMTVVRSENELSEERWQTYMSEDSWPSFNTNDQEEIMGRFFDVRFPEDEPTVRSTESAVPTTIGVVEDGEEAGSEDEESITSKLTDVCWTDEEGNAQVWPEHGSGKEDSSLDLDQVPVRCYDREDGVFQQAVLHSLVPGRFLPPLPHPHQLVSGDYVKEFPLEELLRVCSHPGVKEPRCSAEILPSVEDNADNRKKHRRTWTQNYS